jgi:hypothetical protein
MADSCMIALFKPLVIVVQASGICIKYVQCMYMSIQCMYMYMQSTGIFQPAVATALLRGYIGEGISMFVHNGRFLYGSIVHT